MRERYAVHMTLRSMCDTYSMGYACYQIWTRYTQLSPGSWTIGGQTVVWTALWGDRDRSSDIGHTMEGAAGEGSMQGRTACRAGQQSGAAHSSGAAVRAEVHVSRVWVTAGRSHTH